MTNIEKEIRQGKYYSAYNDLNKIGYVYSIENLMFDPFFHYVYPLVYWHIQKAIILSPSDYTIKEWVLDTFSSSPDSPFTDEELYHYAQSIIRSCPNNVTAQDIVTTYENRL